MNNKMKILIAFILLFQCSKIHAQEKHSSYFISGDFYQIKEEDNLGLVFKGPQLSFGLKFEFPIRNNLLVYQNRIGLGPSFSRGMIAAQFNFKPIDLFYGFNISNKEEIFFLGPTLKTEYNVQFYPQLSGGHAFWFTNYHIGVGSIYEFIFNEHKIKVFFSTSLFGVISRPKPDRDPYWMFFYFSDVISQVHQDLKLASLLDFNNTTLQLEYFPYSNENSFSITYNLEFYGTFNKPNVSFLNHSLSFNFSL